MHYLSSSNPTRLGLNLFSEKKKIGIVLQDIRLQFTFNMIPIWCADDVPGNRTLLV